MATKIKPEVSKKNNYWINKHRYYELKHFCLQYPIWKDAYLHLDSLSKRPQDLALLSTNEHGDPVARCVESRENFSKLMRLVEESAKAADEALWDYILKGVTLGMSYDILKIRLNIPCSRDTYYDRYRKFFSILDKKRQ